MLRLFKCLPGSAVASVLFATLTSAQSPQPSQPAATPQPSPSGVATLRAGTQLVVVDVVVTDKNQKPIHGLKASDFTLIEENIPQVVKHFEEHTALTPADATKFPAMPKLPPGVFTNYTPEPVNGAVNLLLLDALNTPVRDQAYVRQQLLAFLKATPPGTRIAIFGLTSQLTILQGFTSDPETLKAAASKNLGKNSPLLQDSVGGGGIQNSTADDLEDMNIPGLPPDLVANLRQFDAQQQSFQLQLRVKYTLDAMNQLARYLSSIPGRKNLIWFSGSFPISVLPDTTGNLPNPFDVVADYEKEFRDTVNLLARSQVAVYPIDARGLTSAPVFDASTSRNYASPGGRGTARMTQDLNKFSTDTTSEHSTMSQMAEATGGHAFYNTNGLTQAVATAINDGSNFYTLTYTPANPARDGKFRRIKVQLAHGGVNLAYRRGYYADDPDKAPSLTIKDQPSKVADSAVTSATPSPVQAMRVAMMRGSPTPSEIIMKVAVLPVGPSTQTEDTPAPNNLLSEKVHGPFRRYNVSYAIQPSDITFLRAPDGKIHASFELGIFVFNPDGVLVNRLVNQLHVASPLDEIKKSVANGIQYTQQISAPAKGEYFLRIVVHDLTRNRLGAVEVATSEVKNLQPPTAPPAPSTSPSSPTAEPASTLAIPK